MMSRREKTKYIPFKKQKKKDIANHFRRVFFLTFFCIIEFLTLNIRVIIKKRKKSQVIRRQKMDKNMMNISSVEKVAFFFYKI
jgi:hypothetical protein